MRPSASIAAARKLVERIGAGHALERLGARLGERPAQLGPREEAEQVGAHLGVAVGQQAEHRLHLSVASDFAHEQAARAARGETRRQRSPRAPPGPRSGPGWRAR
jgi:hypothetical protein